MAVVLAMKWAAYSGYFVWVAKRSGSTRCHPAALGAARMVLGILVGWAVLAGTSRFFDSSEWGKLGVNPSIYLVLIPPRIAEWWLALRFAFPTTPMAWSRVAAGTGVSFALDLPMALGFVLMIPC